MNFDATVGLGEIIAIITILGSLWTFHKQNIRRIHEMEFRVNIMWKRFAHRFHLREEITKEADDID